MFSDRPGLRRTATGKRRAPDENAAEHLHYIRSVMERSATFTAVPGIGMAIVGFTALAAAHFAHRQDTPSGWLLVWMAEAALAMALGGSMLYFKARSVGVSLRSEPARKYFLSLAPPLLAGAVLTTVLWTHDAGNLLAGVWLLLYGAGTVTAGMASVRVVPLMGACFMAVGVAALFWTTAGDLWMAAGFGGLHIAFGWIIASKYGG